MYEEVGISDQHIELASIGFDAFWKGASEALGGMPFENPTSYDVAMNAMVACVLACNHCTLSVTHLLEPLDGYTGWRLPNWLSMETIEKALNTAMHAAMQAMGFSSVPEAVSGQVHTAMRAALREMIFWRADDEFFLRLNSNHNLEPV
jgi:hypothetical protein